MTLIGDFSEAGQSCGFLGENGKYSTKRLRKRQVKNIGAHALSNSSVVCTGNNQEEK